MTETNPNPNANQINRGQPLCRPNEGRMLAGVAAGFADYFDVDVTVVRIVIAVLAVIGGAGIPLYLAGWLLIPDEGASSSIASDFIHHSPLTQPR
jgi:phage shock protein C